MPYPSDKARKAAHARKKNPLGKAPRRVSLARVAPTKRRVLFRTLPHGEHEVVLVEDARVVSRRIYELRDSEGKVGLLGSEFNSLVKQWPKEQARKGRDEEINDRAKPELAKRWGYDDAWTQMKYNLDRGASVEDAIKSHQAYCKVGDLFTTEHGDDASFLKGARRAYREAREAGENRAGTRLVQYVRDGEVVTSREGIPDNEREDEP